MALTSRSQVPSPHPTSTARSYPSYSRTRTVLSTVSEVPLGLALVKGFAEDVPHLPFVEEVLQYTTFNNSRSLAFVHVALVITSIYDWYLNGSGLFLRAVFLKAGLTYGNTWTLDRVAL